MTGLRTPFMELDGPHDGWVMWAAGELEARVWIGGTERMCRTDAPSTSFDLRHAFTFGIAVGEPLCDGATVAWDSLAVTLRVDGFDPSLSTYWERTTGYAQELFPHEASWGVTGVLGVFGSAAGRRIVLVATPPGPQPAARRPTSPGGGAP